MDVYPASIHQPLDTRQRPSSLYLSCTSCIAVPQHVAAGDRQTDRQTDTSRQQCRRYCGTICCRTHRVPSSSIKSHCIVLGSPANPIWSTGTLHIRQKSQGSGSHVYYKLIVPWQCNVAPSTPFVDTNLASCLSLRPCLPRLVRY